MKKLLLSLLLSFIASSCLLAQEISPSNNSSNQTAASLVQHLEATYDVTSSKDHPRATVTWVANLKNDTVPYFYQVDVTLQNNTDKIFKNWKLAFIFFGSVITYSSEVSAYDSFFSDGPTPGYIIFGPSIDQVDVTDPTVLNQDLAPHGMVTFQYMCQLPASQQTLLSPKKVVLSRALSYVTKPASSDVPTTTP